MALNAVLNERLESKEDLLLALAAKVAGILDLCPARIWTPFTLSGTLQSLQEGVKRVVKHGLKRERKLFQVFGRSSFADFDSWLEERLQDHSFPALLLESGGRETFLDCYYEWALVRDKELLQACVQLLQVLGTREAGIVREVELFLIQRKRGRRMEGQRGKSGSSGIERKILEEFDPVRSEREYKTVEAKDESLEAGGGGQGRATTTTTTATIPIPTFSYGPVSPVCSPPTFAGVEGGASLSASLSSFQETAKNSNSDCDCDKDGASRIPELSVPEHELQVPSTSASGRRRSVSSSFSDLTFDFEKKSFLESGGFLQPAAVAQFPLPKKGQSLTAFLASLTEAMPEAELDRENAHFNVSEALISAFERIKVKVKVNVKRSEEEEEEGSESELEADESKCNVKETGANSGREDVFGTAKEVEERLRKESLPEPEEKRRFRQFQVLRAGPSGSGMRTEDESEIEYWRQRSTAKPPRRGRKGKGKLGSDGLSASISTTEISSSSEEEFGTSSFSAESVGLNLLRNVRMREEQIPAASELKWLVSENETPQALLPMPKGWGRGKGGSSGSEKEVEDGLRLRGTLDWAPPRPQIIFTIHPSASLQILTEWQKYRCAGCGMRVDPKYASTFRYCFYLGRYFCTGCHTGKKARLPQMILHKWDFSPYLVSNFSFTLLERLASDPVYNVLAINDQLMRKVKLNNFRNYRIQLGFLQEYLKNCGKADSLYQRFLKFPSHYAADVDLCSLEDLVNVRFSTGWPMVLRDFVAEGIRHVMDCELCGNLGFICEMCERPEVIYPFQINRVSRCPTCGSCYHLKCFKAECRKCLRQTKRREEIDPGAIPV